MIEEALKDILDIIHLHSLSEKDDHGSYMLVNRGELEQAIERAEKVLNESRQPQGLNETQVNEALKNLRIWGDSEIFYVALWPKIKDDPDKVVQLIKAVANKIVDYAVKIICAKFATPSDKLQVDVDEIALTLWDHYCDEVNDTMTWEECQKTQPLTAKKFVGQAEAICKKISKSN